MSKLSSQTCGISLSEITEENRVLADMAIVDMLLQGCHSDCWCHNVDMPEQVIYY